MAGSPRLQGVIDPFSEVEGLASLSANLSYLFGYEVSRFASTTGTGTAEDPWDGWVATLNALPANTYVHLDVGYYALATELRVKDGVQIQGSGVGTKITSALVGTSFHIAEATTPLSSTTSNVKISDLWIHNSNAACTGSAILFVSGRMSKVEDVKITGHRYGITYINSQLVTTQDVLFGELDTSGGQTRGSLWIVSGGDYNLTYADKNYSAGPIQGSNVLTFIGVQVGNLNSAGHIGVINDGGYNHNFIGCNFNGTYNAFRLSGVGRMVVIGGDHELQGAGIISVHHATYNSGTALAGGASLMGTVQLNSCTFAPTSTNAVVITEAPDAASILAFDVVNCRTSGANAFFQGVATANNAATYISCTGSLIANGTLFDVAPIRYTINGSGPDSSIKTLEVGQNGLQIKQTGTAQARAGTATLAGGVATLANTTITANTSIILSRRTISGTPGHLTYTRNAGVEFVVNSTEPTDAGAFYWELREP